LNLTHLLDTSAVVAYLAQETRSEKVLEVRRTAALAFVTLTELYYVLWRKNGRPLAEEAIQHVLGWHLPLLAPDERLSLLAGYLKATHRLGLADSYLAAFAVTHKLTLVTKDHDFRRLAGDLRLLYL
jgi:predicted nucleic acid-binding protein